jgi:hypothetical protein
VVSGRLSLSIAEEMKVTIKSGFPDICPEQLKLYGFNTRN